MLLTAVSAGEQEEGSQVDLSQLVLATDVPVKPPTQSPALTTKVRGSMEGEGEVCGEGGGMLGLVDVVGCRCVGCGKGRCEGCEMTHAVCVWLNGVFLPFFAILTGARCS